MIDTTESDLGPKSTEVSKYIPDPATGFKLAARSVKIIIMSYINLYAKESLFNTAKKMGCTIFKLPDSYLKHAKLALAFGALSKNLVKKDSLYYIPSLEETEPMEFKRIPTDSILKLNKLRTDITNNIRDEVQGAGTIETIEDEQSIEFQKWQINLVIVDTTQGQIVTPVESLRDFGADRAHIKRMVEGAYNGARGVFYNFRGRYAGLETIDLILDAEEFCLLLVDSQFPEYKHTMKISFRLEKSSC